VLSRRRLVIPNLLGRPWAFAGILDGGGWTSGSRIINHSYPKRPMTGHGRSRRPQSDGPLRPCLSVPALASLAGGAALASGNIRSASPLCRSSASISFPVSTRAACRAQAVSIFGEWSCRMWEFISATQASSAGSSQECIRFATRFSCSSCRLRRSTSSAACGERSE
jgi:hypothetical protein